MMNKSILVIDEGDSELRETAALASFDMTCLRLSEAGAGAMPPCNLIIADFSSWGEEQNRWLSDLRVALPSVPVIALLPMTYDESAEQLVLAGLYDVLTKPCPLARLRIVMAQALRHQRLHRAFCQRMDMLPARVHLKDVIGSHADVVRARTLALHAAAQANPLCIEGLAGTGKSHLAMAVHGESAKGYSPMVHIDCQATVIKEPQEWRAIMDRAAGSTLLLREVAALPLALTEVIADDIGHCAATPAKDGVRVIATTSRNLEKLTQQGRFSPALWSLLRSQIIALPTLNARSADIPELAAHFISRYAALEDRPVQGFTADGTAYLQSLRWTGNVTQLARLVHRCCLLTPQPWLDDSVIRLVMQLDGMHYPKPDNSSRELPSCIDANGRVKQLRLIEDEVIRYAVHTSKGSMSKAARSLGIGRSTLYRRITAMELRARTF